MFGWNAVYAEKCCASAGRSCKSRKSHTRPAIDLEEGRTVDRRLCPSGSFALRRLRTRWLPGEVQSFLEGGMAAPPRRTPIRCSQSAAGAMPRGHTRTCQRPERGGGRRYRCQATQLLEASKSLAWWDPRQYVKDVTSGNASLSTIARVLVLSWFAAWRRCGYPYRLSHRAYDRVHQLLFRRETPYEPAPSMHAAEPEPTQCALGVMPGERVRIKTHAEISPTLREGGIVACGSIPKWFLSVGMNSRSPRG